METNLRSQRENKEKLPCSLSLPVSAGAAALVGTSPKHNPYGPLSQDLRRSQMEIINYPPGYFEAPEPKEGCDECESVCYDKHVTGCKDDSCAQTCQSCKEIVEQDIEEFEMDRARGLS